MSLAFPNSNDIVTFGSAAELDHTDASVFTLLMWFRINTFTGGNTLYGKIATGPIRGHILRLDGSTELNWTAFATSTNGRATSTGLSLTTSVDYFVAATYDRTDSNSVRLFVGSLSALATEPSYSLLDSDTGTLDDSAADLGIGNETDLGVPCQSNISLVALVNRRLSLGEIRSFQFRPRVLPDTALFCHLGFNGTGTQADWSGQGNPGTVSGTTLAPHVPLGPLFGFDSEWFGQFAPTAVDETIWQLAALTTPALGDLLVAVDDPGGTPATKKLALSDFADLTTSDVVIQVKTVGSGTYTPTAGMKKVLGIAVGSGGGGAGGIATDSAGGGGGGGGTVIRLMTAADIGASKAYVVGAGGAAAGAGNATTLDSAGALMNAGGGGAGTAGATFSVIGVSVAGGAGGTASNGNLNIPGQPGKRGVIFSSTDGKGGEGGRSKFGFGGAPGGTNVAGGAGQAYGGGGAGGHASGTANRDGGAGADGILYLIEFIG